MSSQTQGWRPIREEVNDWLREQTLCVFSTLDENGAPMSATVAFSVTKNGVLLIGTSETSHKSRNVDGDARVAMTITNPEQRMTVQLQGEARKISQKDFEQHFEEEHFRLRPESLPFKDSPGQCHILITPTYLKFSDVSVYPWVITEF